MLGAQGIDQLPGGLKDGNSVREKYPPGCELALTSARSRPPAVGNTLPTPLCNLAGCWLGKQLWQRDLEEREGGRKRGGKGDADEEARKQLAPPPAPSPRGFLLRAQHSSASNALDAKLGQFKGGHCQSYQGDRKYEQMN